MRRTSDGLVIRECSVGESDKLLTVLTADRGKILINAKGVRSIKSKNIALCRMFTYANFEYYERNGRFWLASGSVTDSFFGLNSDIEGLSLASYICDVANEISGENAPDETLLRAMLNTLYAIEKQLRPIDQIKGAFEFFAAAHSGFLPDLDGCEKCRKTSSESVYLDVMNGSLLCSSCLGSTNMSNVAPVMQDGNLYTQNILVPITPEVIMAIKYVISAPVNRLFSFVLNKESDVACLSKAGETYLQNHLERGFDTLEFYRTVRKGLK